jgi:16S rRNA (guanine966-N2)-methyltransferase
LRIIGGSLRGRVLKAPKGTATRPTTDRVRESIFNIIAPFIQGAYFLDLFAGSGAIGIEALSRGAKKVVFVEKSKRTASGIRANVQMFGLEDRAEVLVGDVWSHVPKLMDFDLVFADPPFDCGFVGPLLDLVETSGILKDQGFCIIEHSLKESPPQALSGLSLIRQRRYGSIEVSVFRKEEKQNESGNMSR